MKMICYFARAQVELAAGTMIQIPWNGTFQKYAQFFEMKFFDLIRNSCQTSYASLILEICKPKISINAVMWIRTA